jgi:hypothetical protein
MDCSLPLVGTIQICEEPERVDWKATEESLTKTGEKSFAPSFCVRIFADPELSWITSKWVVFVEEDSSYRKTNI